jgi:phage-related protein
MQEFEIVFYKTDTGESPVEDFLDSLNDKMRAKMLMSIRIIRENGYQTRMPYSEELEDGIFELRAKVGTDISRVLYFFMIGRKVILTNGFIKKTQKTPHEEIERAKKYRADYLSREES